MNSGIYKIENKINGKIYVGSSVNITARWRLHKSGLKRGCHDNIYLQRSWNKYGEDKFKFIVLEKVLDKNNLIEREQYYLDLFECYDKINGYNICKNAESSLGFRFSKEDKRRCSEAHKGKKPWNKGIPATEEHKKKLRESHKDQPSPMKGRKHTEESKKKMSIAKKGKKLTEEHRQKFIGRVPWNKGIPRSKEVKDKLSRALKGIKLTEKHKNKISLTLRGRTPTNIKSLRSEKVNRKRSNALKRYWKLKKAS